MNVLLLAIRNLVSPPPKVPTLTPSSCTVNQPTHSLIAAGMLTRISRAVTLQRTEILMVILFQKLRLLLKMQWSSVVIRRGGVVENTIYYHHAILGVYGIK